MAKRQFGVSTHLYRNQRLLRDHLLEIAAHGFEVVEVFALRTHLDFHNESVIADLQQWLAEARLDLHAVRVPAGEQTPEEIELALFIARRLPVPVFIVPVEGTRDVARRNVERLAERAAPLAVKVAIDGPDWSRPGSLVHLVEEDVEADVGICLDAGRANRDGDLVDAIEIVSEHVAAIRLPLDGAIDWASALTTVQKVGYEGPLTFEMDARGSTRETLARARAAREKMERWLTST